MGLTVMYADKGTLKGTAIILMNFFSMLSGLKKEDLFEKCICTFHFPWFMHSIYFIATKKSSSQTQGQLVKIRR